MVSIVDLSLKASLQETLFYISSGFEVTLILDFFKGFLKITLTNLSFSPSRTIQPKEYSFHFLLSIFHLYSISGHCSSLLVHPMLFVMGLLLLRRNMKDVICFLPYCVWCPFRMSPLPFPFLVTFIILLLIRCIVIFSLLQIVFLLGQRREMQRDRVGQTAWRWPDTKQQKQKTLLNFANVQTENFITLPPGILADSTCCKQRFQLHRKKWNSNNSCCCCCWYHFLCVLFGNLHGKGLWYLLVFFLQILLALSLSRLEISYCAIFFFGLPFFWLITKVRYLVLCTYVWMSVCVCSQQHSFLVLGLIKICFANGKKLRCVA